MGYAVFEEAGKVRIEIPEELLKEFNRRRELSIFGLLKDWKINPQKIKDELREE